MKTLFRCLAVAIAAAAFFAIAQRRQISTARTELARLEPGSPVQSPMASRAASPAASDEIKRLRAENRDIYKLRGQISQARDKRREFERMQAENARLREQIKNIKSNPHRASTSSTFSLINKGQATPDAALETTFWSMYQGDVETLSRAMPMATMQFEQMPPEEKTNNLAMLKVMASTIEKLEVVDRKSDSPDEAHLTVRFTAPQGSTLNAVLDRGKTTFVLRRTNDFWQIVGERRE
jgi:hypothetical protein